MELPGHICETWWSSRPMPASLVRVHTLHQYPRHWRGGACGVRLQRPPEEEGGRASRLGHNSLHEPLMGTGGSPGGRERGRRRVWSGTVSDRPSGVQEGPTSPTERAWLSVLPLSCCMWCQSWGLPEWQSGAEGKEEMMADPTSKRGGPEVSLNVPISQMKKQAKQQAGDHL